ncbi:hypothetical protein C8Q69DRAFT_482479 [Paecilomyces variotii]|uniref:Secreted protein n=1 Tax=Byssochlamys spectabilis TaxID=264951 RepID=A0A443HIC5_BYSSP|nr:hypothetical protein C8Q69DRAFT_482479 [Paecilomyces variotii]RWQ91590.1 hypothetical protein C8Q69DRAFT_482479 [Paecilomyces variotii]
MVSKRTVLALPVLVHLCPPWSGFDIGDAPLATRVVALPSPCLSASFPAAAIGPSGLAVRDAAHCLWNVGADVAAAARKRSCSQF